jgi:hypothetical protein
VSYATTEHSLLGAAFERFDTHADGGNDYTKPSWKSPGTIVSENE